MIAMHLFLDTLVFIATVVIGDVHLKRRILRPQPPADKASAHPQDNSREAAADLGSAIADMRATFAAIMASLDRIERKLDKW